MLSQSSFIVPHHVRKKSRNPRVINHFQLFRANEAMPNLWLKEPIKELCQNVMRVRPNTRATAHDIEKGNDIYVGSSSLPAGLFINQEFDDIEFIDYGRILGSRAHLWHSQCISRDGMMRRAIDSVLNNEEGSSGYSHRFLEDHNDVEFIGFVNVYTKANSERSIQAFHIVAMALFRFDIPQSKTIIGSLISAR